MQEFANFDYFRPIFTFLIIVLLISSVIGVLQKTESKMINGFSAFMISLICSVVAGMIFYKMGYIADELNLRGDQISIYMVIAIAALSIANLLIYFLRSNLKIKISPSNGS